MRSDTSSSSRDTIAPGGPGGGPVAARTLASAKATSSSDAGSATANSAPPSSAAGSSTAAGAGIEPCRATSIGQSPQSNGLVESRVPAVRAFLRQQGHVGSRDVSAEPEPFRTEHGTPTNQ